MFAHSPEGELDRPAVWRFVHMHDGLRLRGHQDERLLQTLLRLLLRLLPGLLLLQLR